MRSRREANLLVNRIVSEVCAAADTPLPRVVLSFDGPDLTLSMSGRPLLRYPVPQARTEPEDVIRGTIAHEIAHQINNDVRAQTRMGMLAVFAKVAILLSPSAVLGLTVSLGSYYRGILPLFDAWQLGAAVGAGTLATLMVLVQLGWLQFPELIQQEQPRQVRELRADLTAVGIVGVPPTVAFLEWLRDEERRRPPVKRTGLRRLHASGPRTHPPTELRLATVRTFTEADDPTETALRVLRPAGPTRRTRRRPPH